MQRELQTAFKADKKSTHPHPSLDWFTIADIKLKSNDGACRRMGRRLAFDEDTKFLLHVIKFPLIVLHLPKRFIDFLGKNIDEQFDFENYHRRALYGNLVFRSCEEKQNVFTWIRMFPIFHHSCFLNWRHLNVISGAVMILTT